MFKENGWDLVWPFFMDEKVGARLGVYVYCHSCYKIHCYVNVRVSH